MSPRFNRIRTPLLPSAGLIVLAILLTLPGFQESNSLQAATPDETTSDGNSANLNSAGTDASSQDVTRVGLHVDEFSLQDYRGKEHALSDYKDKSVVVLLFLGTECPLVKLYAPRLVELEKQYAEQGVQLLAINANQQDSITEIAAYARRHDIKFPILKDAGNQLADTLHAVRTPEVYVLDQQRNICYWGRIDNKYGVGYIRNGKSEDYLTSAIDQLLKGEKVLNPQVESVGCYIGRVRKPKADSAITYSNQIARIFQNHCVECHRDGEIAPFTLTSYDDVTGWGETIAEVIEDQRMPPWHADPAHGEFANARGMSAEEKQQVYAWVDAGCPEGNPKELPEPQTYLTGWQLPREPDVVINMRDRPFEIAAEGDIAYQYFVADTHFEEDKWVVGAEVIPGNRAVVHHVIVSIRPPDGTDVHGLGWLTGYVPGQRIEKLGEGMARFIPAGSKLVFQMHYTPNGSVESDMTKLGLVFADAKTIDREVISLAAMNNKFEIPPGDDAYRVESRLRNFPKDGELLAITPHMHLRGKDFKVNLVSDDGKIVETFLDVPNYDFNWQSVYALANGWKPGTEKGYFECIAHFNNSESNLANPDPTAAVRWGDQTWEEMMIGFFEVAIPRRDLAKPEKEEVTPLSTEQQQKVESIVEELNAHLDVNKDGRIERSEVTKQFARFGFRKFDHNDNGLLEREELTLEAEARVRHKSRR